MATSTLPPPVAPNNCYGFARRSVFERIPAIVQALLKQGAVQPQSVEPLLDDIAKDKPFTPVFTGHSLDHYNKIIEAHEYKWSTAPWFFLESYFYRKLYDTTKYFENGKDPFKIVKREQLESSFGSTQQLCAILVKLTSEESKMIDKDLKIILYECLWGNRADLSFNPSLSTDDLLSKLSDCNSYILVDDSESLFNHVSNLTDGKLHIVVDNVGMDVVSDLVLATLLIHFGHIGSATFHVKQDPMYAINVTGINTHRFVSDVTTSDFEEMMSFMDKQTDPIIKQINRLWKEYLESEKWVVVSNTCWNRFEPFWELPAEILDLFKASDLVIFKGDANARRVHGDLRWPHTTPTGEVTKYLTDSVGLAMFRTLKSETATGLSKKALEKLCTEHKLEDNDEWCWLSSGRYGVVQFVPPESK